MPELTTSLAAVAAVVPLLALSAFFSSSETASSRSPSDGRPSARPPATVAPSTSTGCARIRTGYW